MITIDGGRGEGGGQIVRTALSLSLVTGRAFRVRDVRGGRAKPGLLRQHLTAVQAAAAVGQARVEGAELGSRELTFEPGRPRGGSYSFAVGTAGSAMLVLHTVLPALLRADGPSDVVLMGGTHNPAAPPYEAFEQALLPILRAMGAEVVSVLERPGFYPAGGGMLQVHVEPCARLGRLDLRERGAVVRQQATALLAQIRGDVGERELATLRERLGWPADRCMLRTTRASRGPGNVLLARVESERVTEVFTAFGERGKPAEAVAHELADEVSTYLEAGVAVGPHLADQLIVPMVLGEGGEFTTVEPTLHTTTQLETVRAFVDVRAQAERVDERRWLVRVG